MKYKVERDLISHAIPLGIKYFIFKKRLFGGWKRLEFMFDNKEDAADQLDILEGRRHVNYYFIYSNEDL